MAANAARAGFIEQIRPGLETIDFSAPSWTSSRSADGALLPQDRLDYARLLFRVLDELTFRIWAIPGDSEPGTNDGSAVTVSLEQAGTAHQFELTFARRGSLWLIDPPPPDRLEEALEELYERSGGTAPGMREHLQLQTPRATMRTFLEEVRNFDSGGREQVERTMDLDNLGSVQQEDSRLLAQYLKNIIDRIGFVVYQEIPNDPGHREPYVHFRHGAGAVEIAPFAVGEERVEWRFTADTLRRLRYLYSAMDGMPTVAGVTEME